MTQEQQLIASLTANITALSNEVNRTYGIYVSKDLAYASALALEVEIDRQRLEKIGQNDWYNADILSSQLRETVRPNREAAGNEKAAALLAWNTAKADLALEKTKLSSAEQNYMTAAINAGIAASNSATATANAQAAVTTANAAVTTATAEGLVLETKSKSEVFANEAKAAQTKKNAIIAGIVVVGLFLGAFVYFKFIKK